MLRSLEDLEDYSIGADDGLIGHVRDFLFDDDTWVVRYLIVGTGPWFWPRKVLISPISVRRPDWLARTLSVSITSQQVRDSPDVDTGRPVTRQAEEHCLDHYGYPRYWDGAAMWGGGLYPGSLSPGQAGSDAEPGESARRLAAYLVVERARFRNDEPHLRSCNALLGFLIHAVDGYVGRVAGFLIDDETWAMRYLVVDTGRQSHGRKVLIAPPWLTGVQWSDEIITVDLSRTSIQNAPAYQGVVGWGHIQDMRLHRHHGRSDHRADNRLYDAVD